MHTCVDGAMGFQRTATVCLHFTLILDLLMSRHFLLEGRLSHANCMHAVNRVVVMAVSYLCHTINAVVRQLSQHIKIIINSTLRTCTQACDSERILMLFSCGPRLLQPTNLPLHNVACGPVFRSIAHNQTGVAY